MKSEFDIIIEQIMHSKQYLEKDIEQICEKSSRFLSGVAAAGLALGSLLPGTATATAVKEPATITSTQSTILDNLVKNMLTHEGLVSGQTPFRITNSKMRNWKTIHGYEIDWTTPKPKGRENFIFLKNPSDVFSAVRRQIISYLLNPLRYGLGEMPTLRDLIHKFDQSGAEGKLAYLDKKMPGLDFDMPAKNLYKESFKAIVKFLLS